jgi:hypothetical protein
MRNSIGIWRTMQSEQSEQGGLERQRFVSPCEHAETLEGGPPGGVLAS